MSDKEKASSRYNKNVGPKEYLKSELLAQLRKIGYDTTKKRYLKSGLITISKEKGLPTSKESTKVIDGWCNKLKGMLQILYARGYIDILKVVHPWSMEYSKYGKKRDHDSDGKLTDTCKTYSLHHILSNTSDFATKKSDLEHLCTNLSTSNSTITVTFTPKFHCKISGKGIEYSWGISKNYYRRIPYNQKRSFQQLVTSVKLSLSKVTIRMAWRFSQKARSYMLGYHHQSKKDRCEVRWLVKSESSYTYNKKIHKLYKSHRDVATTDFAFIQQVINEYIQ